MICFRCTRNKKKYAKCIRVDKKCDFAMFKVNFFNINQIMIKLEKN